MSWPIKKPSYDWGEADIQSLILNATMESISLDYKQSDSLAMTDGKKAEISKDVSAFANSAGGVIVYGVAENKLIPTHVDGGCDPAVITKEWLEQIINSRIQPRIDGVRINQVPLSSTHPGRVAYIVEIPQSTGLAPHQAGDKRYYKRFNFQSVPMEDYEIRDVMRRASGPDVLCSFAVHNQRNYAVSFRDGDVHSNAFPLNVILENQSPVPAYYASIDFFVDHRLDISGSAKFNTNVVVEYHLGVNDFLLDVKTIHKNWAVPADPPIFKGARIEAFPVAHLCKIPSGLEYETAQLVVGARIVAPEMEPKWHCAILNYSHGQIGVSTVSLEYLDRVGAQFRRTTFPFSEPVLFQNDQSPR